MIARALFIALLLAAPDEAGAGQRTIYGADGRVVGREATGSNGDTTLYGADGRVEGRSSTSGRTTTFYGADGRRTGTEVGRWKDPTEAKRRAMIESGQPMKDLAQAGRRWTTDELRAEFDIGGFLAPVRRSAPEGGWRRGHRWSSPTRRAGISTFCRM